MHQATQKITKPPVYFSADLKTQTQRFNSKVRDFPRRKQKTVIEQLALRLIVAAATYMPNLNKTLLPNLTAVSRETDRRKCQGRCPQRQRNVLSCTLIQINKLQ